MKVSRTVWNREKTEITSNSYLLLYNINNNWYTNYIAKWCLDYAVENILRLEKECNECIDRNNVTREEVEFWKIISNKMYLLYDEELQIIIQNDNF